MKTASCAAAPSPLVGAGVTGAVGTGVGRAVGCDASTREENRVRNDYGLASRCLLWYFFILTGAVGGAVGAFVGGCVGTGVGCTVGRAVGRFVGSCVGNGVGGTVGFGVGALVGSAVGFGVGDAVRGVVGFGVGGEVGPLGQADPNGFVSLDKNVPPLATSAPPYLTLYLPEP